MRNTICLLLAGLLSINAANATHTTPSRIPFYILNAATAYNIDVNLMYAICLTESRCRASAINKNDGTAEEKAAGIKVKSFGLFQIKASTARNVGFVDSETVITTFSKGKRIITKTKIVDHSRELLKPEINSLYAAKLLHKLYNKYHSTEKVISAYNAGHPIKGNSEYVLKVLKQYIKLTIDKRN